MATRTDHIIKATVRAAKHAKRWAMVAARETDRVLKEARKQADSEDRQRRRKQTFLKAGRVLRAAGHAALVAGVVAGIAAVRAERRDRALSRGR